MTNTNNFFIDNDLRITCADATELVTDFFDDALGDRDHGDFVTHLSLCEGCQAFADQITTTIALLGAITKPDSDVLPANFDRLLNEFEDHHRSS